MRIFLDDLRNPEEWLPNMGWFRGRDPKELGEWAWVKSAFEAITLLETRHVVEMSLDFDLGDRDEVGDGYMVVTWVEEHSCQPCRRSCSPSELREFPLSNH
ncbi:MAG: hypothetical protein M3P18_26480 [Actinomycetota bacterium]|nr:hypothetical protein [Actinomycetota bacterium]